MPCLRFTDTLCGGTDTSSDLLKILVLLHHSTALFMVHWSPATPEPSVPPYAPDLVAEIRAKILTARLCTRQSCILSYYSVNQRKGSRPKGAIFHIDYARSCHEKDCHSHTGLLVVVLHTGRAMSCYKGQGISIHVALNNLLQETGTSRIKYIKSK